MMRLNHLILTVSIMLAGAPLATGQTQRAPGSGSAAGRGRGDVTTLLAMPEVQKELRVTDEQKRQIQKIVEELRDSGRAGGGGTGSNRTDLQTLSEDERQKRLEELRKQGLERAKKAEERVKTVLKQDQISRLTELQLQREGPLALDREEPAEKLNLTREQKEKIHEIREKLRADRTDRSQEDRQKANIEARQRREKASADILAILNSEQKETWKEMQGAQFEFPTTRGPSARPGGQ